VKHRIEPAKLRVMFGAQIAMGPGKADLLQAIAATGSITAAARRMDMSYRRAWNLVSIMNGCFREPLVDTATGGEGGGGASVTPFGQQVLARFRKMQQGIDKAIAADIAAFSALLSDSPPA
jgi:molybdate transport system regulatory protein